MGREGSQPVGAYTGNRRASSNSHGSTGQDHRNWPLRTDAWTGPDRRGGTTNTPRFVVGRHASGAGAQTLSGSASCSVAAVGKPTRAWDGRPTVVLGGRSRSLGLPGDSLGTATEGLAPAVPDRFRRRRPQ